MAEDISKVEEIELPQLRNEVTDTGLVSLKTQPKVLKRRSIKKFAQDFTHALRWSQLRRLLNPSGLLFLIKRHSYKLAAGCLIGAALWQGAIRFSVGNADPNQPAQAGVLSYSNHQQSNLHHIPDAELLPQHNDQTRGTVATIHSIQQLKALFSNINQKVQQQYLKRFTKVAADESKRFQIPTPIILGLAILSSEFGTSDLAINANNHFAIDCSSNQLPSNIIGKMEISGDCYMHFQNAWASFRANSQHITSGDFKNIVHRAKGDVQLWAESLEALGYIAPNFSAENLLFVIQFYQLDKLTKK